jgi:peptidoglycan-associated lipoprotein
MKFRTSHVLPVIVALSLACFLLACSKKTPEAQPAPAPAPAPAPQGQTGWTPEPKPPETLKVETSADLYNKQGVLKRIHFETDKWDILPADRQILKDNAAWLLAHSQFSVVVEGHCDERNTEAYNLALGERRANAAKEYLVGLGVAPSKIQTVSYGKARPLCTQDTEACWAQNRRCEFVLQDAK